jgi:hypothetical protein
MKTFKWKNPQTFEDKQNLIRFLVWKYKLDEDMQQEL